MLAIGLMSGTSLDGVDTALCNITGSGLDTKIELVGFETYAMPEAVKEEIKCACSIEKSNVELICSLNFKLGKLFSDAVRMICEKYNISSNDIAFVASHGQTIYHQPNVVRNLCASTLQIGEPAIIAYENDVKVISNFRVMDMAAGGEGAPLVPYSEYILYHDQHKTRALQNIGGIGNVTIIPADGDINDVYAFDTGPGNMMIDEACMQLFQLKYDADGEIAASGTINEDLLKECMAHTFFTKKPPKSTGREDFGEDYVTALLNKYQHLPKADIIATFTMFTAKSIAKSYRDFVFTKHQVDEILIGGGGAHNETLLTYLRSELPECIVLAQEDIGYSSDAKEAIAFVILGNETMHNKCSNVPSATGASRFVILGNITGRPFGEEYEV